MLPFERVLGSVSLFQSLRPDEVGRVAARFGRATLAPGEVLSLGPDAALHRIAVVVTGQAELSVDLPGGGTLSSTLDPGDRGGDLPLLTGHGRPARLVARAPTTLALLDRAGLEGLLAEFPAVALELVGELAHELALRNDVARELDELHAEGLPPAELAAAVEDRREALLQRGAQVSRLSPGALFHRAVVVRGAEPPFWALTGFIVSLTVARLVVAGILHFGLEHRLFALVPGNDPNPMHVHHFNYGLVLIGLSGMAALFPLGRRVLRVLAFLFGVGCGLVFDEFALFWNLNPEYAQRLSLVAAALMAGLLAQAVYFREFWQAVLRRLVLTLRGAR
jgi:CRP-like cAMP-binding protein